MSDADKIIRPTFGTIEGGKADTAPNTFYGEDIDAKIAAISVADFDTIKLSEPKYGDHELSKLTDDECVQFARFHAVMNLHKEVSRELGGSQLEMLGAGIRSGKIDMEKGPADAENFIDHDLATDYFRLLSYLDFYKDTFYHGLYLRLGNWEYSLGIRTHRRIVRAKRRY